VELGLGIQISHPPPPLYYLSLPYMQILQSYLLHCKIFRHVLLYFSLFSWLFHFNFVQRICLTGSELELVGKQHCAPPPCRNRQQNQAENTIIKLLTNLSTNFHRVIQSITHRVVDEISRKEISQNNSYRISRNFTKLCEIYFTKFRFLLEEAKKQHHIFITFFYIMKW
jgi:hypothetical protein